MKPDGKLTIKYKVNLFKKKIRILFDWSGHKMVFNNFSEILTPFHQVDRTYSFGNWALGR